VVVEHLRPLDEQLREGERAAGVAGEQDPVGDRRGRLEVDRVACHGAAP
jgi:hypothetical protein